MAKAFPLVAIFFFIVSFVFLVPAALPNKGEEIVSYLSNQFNRAENQKELIDSLQLKKDQKSEVVDFLRKYRKEGLPVPRTLQKQTVLILKYNDGKSEIDFEKYEGSSYKIDGKVVDVLPSDTVETIYQRILPKKVSSLWLNSAEAASLAAENKAAYAALCLRTAEIQKVAATEQTTNAKPDKSADGKTEKLPGTR